LSACEKEEARAGPLFRIRRPTLDCITPNMAPQTNQAALAAYAEVLKQFHELVLRGKIPKQLRQHRQKDVVRANSIRRLVGSRADRLPDDVR
jgi:hypothetical protein